MGQSPNYIGKVPAPKMMSQMEYAAMKAALYPNVVLSYEDYVIQWNQCFPSIDTVRKEFELIHTLDPVIEA